MTDSQIASLLWLAILIAGAIGWIMNIVHLANSDALSGFVILRVVGIFMFPLGAVLGFV